MSTQPICPSVNESLPHFIYLEKFSIGQDKASHKLLLVLVLPVSGLVTYYTRVNTHYHNVDIAFLVNHVPGTYAYTLSPVSQLFDEHFLAYFLYDLF